MVDTPETVLNFWREAGPSLWFAHDEAFDKAIQERFLSLYDNLSHNKRILSEHHSWELTADGALALSIVLDQFPRQIFRGQARAYESDPLARAVAKRSLTASYDQQVPRELRSFFYLPFMHSEDLADQDRCVALYERLGHAEGLQYAQIHRDAIMRFGRFPHRNPVLGRITTPAEQAYLDSGGFSG